MSKPRDPYFDNVRGTLIVFVVIGHLLPTASSPAGLGIVWWIYSFHMPAFVLISGYLARHFTATPRQCVRLITGIMIPYFIFQVIHALLKSALLAKPIKVQFVYPSWTLWFLIALVIWRLLTPLIRVVRFPLFFAVLIALVMPLDGRLDQAWSMARVIGFLPFYVLGLVLEPKHFTLLRSWVKAWMGWVFLAAVFAFVFTVGPELRVSLFFLNESYAGREDTVALGVLKRVFALGLGLAGTVAILAVTNSRKNLVTRLGRYSIYVYLLHPLVLFPLRYLALAETWTSPAQTVLLVIGGALLALLLATPPVIYLTRWVIDPPWAQRLLLPEGSGHRG